MIELTDEEWASIESIKDVHYLIKGKFDYIKSIVKDYDKQHTLSMLFPVTPPTWDFVLIEYQKLSAITRQDKVKIYEEALIRKLGGIK